MLKKFEESWGILQNLANLESSFVGLIMLQAEAQRCCPASTKTTAAQLQQRKASAWWWP